ncbi:MAG: RNB domain-containing ribonuclease, partial [Turneriella sp.]|nr:RNB domain-containing ribonuclease [Turneriella sp.]
LPEILSNEFCSLKPRTRRLAFSVRMFFDLSGNMLRYELFRSWIFIRKRYTYKEAASVLQRKNNPLADAMALARILIERRDRKGRIDLNMAEMKAIYDKEGRLLSLEREERLDSHRLVEECMLSANQAVADYALKNHIPILHRNHEDMPAEKLEKLNRFLQKFAPRLKLRSSEQQEINRVLGSDRLNPIREIFQILLLRSFMQANYTPDSRGHWGLAFSAYAHFTSPIRRFADLVTHLQIAAHLDNRGSHFTRAELEHFGREASRLERVAFEAERADKKLLAVRALRDRVGEIFSAWLSGFTSEVLFIQLVDFPVEGEIPAIEADRYGSVRILDDFTVYVGKLGRTLSLGDPLQVELLRADPVEISLHFRPARAKN